MLSARWARSGSPESLSLLARESPPALPPLSRKSVTSMAKSMSLSWLWLPKAAGAAVRSKRSGTGEPPPACGATLAEDLRRGATAAGGERANSLATSIISDCDSPAGVEGIESNGIDRIERWEGVGGWGMNFFWWTKGEEKPTQRNATRRRRGKKGGDRSGGYSYIFIYILFVYISYK